MSGIFDEAGDIIGERSGRFPPKHKTELAQMLSVYSDMLTRTKLETRPAYVKLLVDLDAEKHLSDVLYKLRDAYCALSDVEEVQRVMARKLP